MSSAHQILSCFLQLLLVLPLLWQLCRFISDARELCSPRTLVSFGFVGLYVASYYVADEYDRNAFLSEDSYIQLLVLAVLACYAYLFGFLLGGGAPVLHRCSFHRDLACTCSLMLIAAGFAGLIAFVHESGGFWAFYSAPHGSAGAWADTSAYLYALPHLMFPAAFILYAVLVHDGLLTLFARVALLLTLTYNTFQAFVFGNRGDTIKLFLLLVLPLLFLVGRRRLLRPIVLLTSAAVVYAVLIFPHIRNALHLGAETSIIAATERLFEEDAVSLGAHQVSGHELFFAAGVVQAASDGKVYDFGLAWIYPFVNLVPRAWWPNKPYAAKWSIDRLELVQHHAGWTVATGSAPTGVADAFLSFSWFSIIVWLALGWWGGRIWRAATCANGVLELAYLWAYLIIAAYFVTQGYRAAWHAWLFLMVPIWFIASVMSYRAGLSASGVARAIGAAGSMPTLRTKGR